MKYLSEVTRIVTTFRDPNIEIIEESEALASGDAISKLYTGLRNGSIDSDQRAAEVVYGKPILDTKYTTLKNRLKKRLLNSLFFLNIRPPSFSEFAAALYQSNKNIFLVKTLVALGGRNTAMKIAQSALAHSEKYNLTSNSVELLYILRGYSSFLGNIKNYDEYNEKLNTGLKTFQAECLAQEYSDRVSIIFARSSAEHPEMKEIIEQYSSELRMLSEKFGSKNLNYNYFRIQTLSFQISRDYFSSIKMCKQAEEYITENPHLFSKIQIGEFFLQRLASHLMLKQYNDGKEVIEKLDKLYDPRTTFGNWFIYMEYAFYLSMHTEHFIEAESIYKKVVEYPKFSEQPEHKKEAWKLFELYLQFAVRVTEENHAKIIFDPKKFLRNVPSYTKDKRGYNVALLILQILLLLENNQFGEIINRMDALRTYRSRYLRAGSNKKSALFFKMLQIMETNHFSYELTNTKSRKYFEKMQTIAADFSEMQDGLQVLPFDWVWNKILNMLSQKENEGIIPKVEKGKARKGKTLIGGYTIPSSRPGAHE
jgi:hypothetical protein